MIYLPPLRRLLLPAIVLLALIVFYRSHLQGHAFPPLILHPSPASPEGIHRSIANLKTNSLPIFNASHNHLSPPKQYYYSDTKVTNKTLADALTSPLLNPALDVLFKCAFEPNKYTGHIRLPNIVQNISQIQAGSKSDGRVFWNPTIISLPYWSKNQYLVVSRIVTDGNHQENVLCEANVCYVGSENDARPGEMPCTEDDLLHVGPAGGMRCATPVTTLSVPPTPAEHCEGKFNSYVDIPGFHDPRIFWSGRGEPLMMVNTQSALPSTASPILFSPLIQADIPPLLDRSRYACFGLWLIDLRTLHPPLSRLLTVSPTRPSLGPLKSYASLTELTRNPPSTRSPIEKNWMLFFPSTGESYIHYDLSGPRSGRTFAKLLGNGLTTSNLTDPLEQPCLRNLDKEETDEKKKGGTWHQATNSLRLILCNRSDKDTEKGCKPTEQNTVFFALIHRKFPNFLKLPLRYERYFIVWSASPPFSMLGVSKHPLLMANETASGWTQSQNWDDDPTNRKHVTSTKKLQQAENIGAFKNRDGGRVVVNATEPYGGKGYWAYFTYTVSISYAWGREGDEVGDKNVGYLDDEVVLGIGVDDKGQGFARVKARDLVACLRACPGREG